MDPPPFLPLPMSAVGPGCVLTRPARTVRVHHETSARRHATRAEHLWGRTAEMPGPGFPYRRYGGTAHRGGARTVFPDTTIAVYLGIIALAGLLTFGASLGSAWRALRIPAIRAAGAAA